VRPKRSTTPGTSISHTISFGGSESSDDVEEPVYYVLGGGHAGVAIAERLRTDGHRVVTVDRSYRPGDVPGFVGDPTDLSVLSETGIERASTVVVAMRSDRRNLLVAQLVRSRFDVPRIIGFVNDPDRRPLFTEAGHEPFCATTALSEALGGVV
jgi:Trk K+ transport system NAD-binding subunit